MVVPIPPASGLQKIEVVDSGACGRELSVAAAEFLMNGVDS
jgi:hypothetical protein